MKIGKYQPSILIIRLTDKQGNQGINEKPII
jgi:hypothetical protein